MTKETVRTARVAPFMVFAVPFIVFAVGVLLVTAASAVLGPPDMWAGALLLALFVVTVVWVGWRTSWRPLSIVGAMLSLVILGFATGFAFSVAFPSMGPLVDVREDRVMAHVRGLAADAGFTARVVPDGQSVDYVWPVGELAGLVWPVGELADPAGFTLTYGHLRWGSGLSIAAECYGLSIAEYRATELVAAGDLQSLVAAGQPIAPGLSQVIPEGAASQGLTVQGGPAVGLEYVDDTGQRASVLVTVIGDVVVRVWGCGRDPTPLVAAT